jgi:hypothetical protein
VSQVFEWLPFNGRELDQVPKGQAERREWIKRKHQARLAKRADRFRDRLIETYGRDRGSQMNAVEVFEVSEYAAQLDADARRRLFPAVP